MITMYKQFARISQVNLNMQFMSRIYSLSMFLDCFFTLNRHLPYFRGSLKLRQDLLFFLSNQVCNKFLYLSYYFQHLSVASL